MRLTRRCFELLEEFPGAGGLTTSQVRRRFFPRDKTNATSKRLYKLTEAKYLMKHQEHRMREAFYTLGREGKRVLERVCVKEIMLQRKPPKLLEHFMGVNDLRIAAELAGPLTYFFAYWELPGIG